jgi:hypothetical protein
MRRDPRRLIVVVVAASFVASSIAPFWVTTVRKLGGQGRLDVYAGATPWDGYFWPWFGIALASLMGAAVVALSIHFRGTGPRSAIGSRERWLYAAAGIVGGGAMAVAVYVGPGGSFNDDAGLFITRAGPLAYVGLLLAAAPLVVALLLRPARRALALATALSLVLATTVLALQPTTFRPQPPTGPIPDWRTTPEEPYPFTGPVPPIVATALDGTYSRPPTDTYEGPPRARCTRCPPFPKDAGRSTLRFDHGRFYLSQEMRRYETFGHFVITRSHVTLFNDPECGEVRGVYRWRLDGNQLALTPLFDLCAFGQRARDMTDSVWTIAAAE